jgi:hypothetical protein
MKKYLTLIGVFLNILVFSQRLSTDEIRKLAFDSNKKIQGVNIGNGIVVRGCRSYDRTLVYEYDVPKNWRPTVGMKQEAIENLKEIGVAKMYSQGDVQAEYIYYDDKVVVKKITIHPDDFQIAVTYQSKPAAKIDFGLGDYISLKDIPKAKGVNMKIQTPKSWDVSDGNRPNIARIFSKDGRTYSILVKDNVSFFSRNEIKELLEDHEFTKDMIAGMSEAFKDPKVLKREIVTIDTYPAIEYMFKGNREQMGINMSLVFKGWVIYYEDKIIYLQGATLSNEDSESFLLLYDQITNSVVFPDQYE